MLKAVILGRIHFWCATEEINELRYPQVLWSEFPLSDDFLFSGLDFILYKAERVGEKIFLKITVGVFFSLHSKNIWSCFRHHRIGPSIELLLLFSKRWNN